MDEPFTRKSRNPRTPPQSSTRLLSTTPFRQSLRPKQTRTKLGRNPSNRYNLLWQQLHPRTSKINSFISTSPGMGGSGCCLYLYLHFLNLKRGIRQRPSTRPVFGVARGAVEFALYPPGPLYPGYGDDLLFIRCIRMKRSPSHQAWRTHFRYEITPCFPYPRKIYAIQVLGGSGAIRAVD